MVVQALTDSLRAAVERATAAYVAAAGTANPAQVLQQGGFTPLAAQAAEKSKGKPQPTA